jgi:hypothetical protein
MYKNAGDVVENSGANPTIVKLNASVVNVYNPGVVTRDRKIGSR